MKKVLTILFFLLLIILNSRNFMDELEQSLDNAENMFDLIEIQGHPLNIPIILKLEKKVKCPVIFAGEDRFYLEFDKVIPQNLLKNYDIWQLYFNAKGHSTPNEYFKVIVDKSKQKQDLLEALWINKYREFTYGIKDEDIQKINDFIQKQELDLKTEEKVWEFISILFNILSREGRYPIYIKKNLDNLEKKHNINKKKHDKIIKYLNFFFKNYYSYRYEKKENYVRFYSWDVNKYELIIWTCRISNKGEIKELKSSVVFCYLFE